MWRKKATSYSGALIAYLGLITFLRWQFSWAWGWFWLGGFVGMIFFNADHLVYLLWQDPQDPNSARLRSLLKNKKIGPIVDFLAQTAFSRTRLVAHSIVFQLVLVILGFFAITSTVGIFGKGLMMGLLLYPLLDQGEQLLKGKGIEGWFWQIAQVPSFRDQTFYFLAMMVVFVIFSWMLIT